MALDFLLEKQLCHCVEYLSLEGSRVLAVTAFLQVSLCFTEALVPLIGHLHSPRSAVPAGVLQLNLELA